MAFGRIRLGLEEHELNGPFSTVDAVAAVGMEQMKYLNTSGSIFWSDHSKRYYYGYQEVNDRHVVNAPWFYEVANPLDECSAQYGRARIYRYETCVLIVDSFTRETYISKSLPDAFEIAVMLVHYFPDERVVPDVELGYKAVLPKMLPTQADMDTSVSQGSVRVYDNGKRREQLERLIPSTMADAVSIIMGDRPSAAFMAELCNTFPQALVTAYGAPLIVYCTESTAISVAQSIGSLAVIQGIDSKDAIESYVSNRKVGRYTVVGGWGYRMLEQYGKDANLVALVDIALAHAGSPEIARATLIPLIDR